MRPPQHRAAVASDVPVFDEVRGATTRLSQSTQEPGIRGLAIEDRRHPSDSLGGKLMLGVVAGALLLAGASPFVAFAGLLVTALLLDHLPHRR